MPSTLFRLPFLNPPQPALHLERYPARKRDSLQAWDAADELLLEEAYRLIRSWSAAPSPRILILQDTFGALTVGLREYSPTSVSDSFVSQEAIRRNLQANPGSGGPQLLRPLEADWGRSTTPPPFDLVLIRIPKNQSYFEDLLHRLSFWIHSETKIVCGIMVKHQAKSSFELLQKIIGPTHTSLASKKARLIFARPSQPATPTPHPKTIRLEGFPKDFLHHAHLFSRERLDIGTRFFLDHLPQDLPQGRILDLGCANGIIGIRTQELNPKTELIFSDDSSHAVASAQENYSTYFPGKKAQFLWLNCFEGQPAGSVDWVLCNPPFHQENRVGDDIARQMFRDAHASLRAGGKLRIVGNRHLGYLSILNRIFGNATLLAQNSKFMILESTR